jgi:acyl-CoA thioester hydrolase
MYINEVQIRVRYAETDQMGYVYYGNYATYFEVARVETIRSFGFSYKQLEERGVMLPVLDMKTKFIKPAKYDDLLTIKVIIKEKPTTRFHFDYEIYNEAGTLLNVSETTLVFVNMQSGRPCTAPEELLNALMARFVIEKND